MATIAPVTALLHESGLRRSRTKAAPLGVKHLTASLQTRTQTGTRTTYAPSPECTAERAQTWHTALGTEGLSGNQKTTGMQGLEWASTPMHSWSQAPLPTDQAYTQTVKTVCYMQGKNKPIPPLRLKGGTLGARHLPVGGRGDETLAWKRIKINLLSSIGSFLLLTLTSTLYPKLTATGLKSMATLSLYSTAYLVFPLALSYIMATSPPTLSTHKAVLTCSKPAKSPPPAEICLLSLAMTTLAPQGHNREH
jgi:hypothetical protein